MIRKALIFAILISTSQAMAGEREDAHAVFGSHPGYLFNVGEERTKRDVEMVMLDKPKPAPADKNRRVLVDQKLTKEFQTQYQYRFGTTAAEQIINNPSRDSEYTYYNNHSITLHDYQIYQRQFGDYMIRRLAEYHIDNWFRNDPDLKPIYEMKDKLSNLNVQVKKGYKMKVKYNLSGPSMEVMVDNPYDIETRLQIMMSGLISSPKEEIFSLGYNLTPRVRIEALYRQYQRLTQLVLSRQMTKHTSLSLTGSSGLIPDTTTHQDLALIGFGWSE